jgi:lipopolysaccharide/colanic/teichoic acid biosynthesis glycosyltransferase
MRINNVLHDQPIKRNDGLNHNRDLTISIGGTGPVAFGHPLRYLLNRLKLHTLRQFKRVSVATHFFVVDLIFSNLILAAYLTRSIVFPAERKSTFSLSRLFNSICMYIKMGIDYLGAFFGLILLMPLFLIIAILIKLDSSGSVFYSQVRVGLNRRRTDRRGASCDSSSDRRNRDRRRSNVCGKPFNVYKFRTMIENAEKKCGPIWASENDPRITRVGAFLRKTRMDELPQLFNILKGDMSLIGPRPERPMFIMDLSRKVDNYTKRLNVKPGITGLAQVENGYDSSIDSVKDKVAYDLRYINRWSLWQDIRILLKTVIVVITGRGAF